VSGGVAGTLRTYRGLLRDRTFVGLVLVAGLAMSAVMSYVSGASFVFQEQFGLNQQQFGLAFSSGAIWLILASQLNPVLLRRFEPRQLLLGAITMAAGASLLLVSVAVSGVGGLPGLLVPLWLVLLSVGFGLPNAPAVALSRHGETAGTAAAMLGATQFGVGALISPLVGVLGNDAAAMATTIAAGLLLSLLVLVSVVRPWRLADVDAVPATAS
jgi:DHA1 family bicyclomycin/chloramphenicol resistance-like MFS transporter